jgi:hypothetical protein
MRSDALRFNPFDVKSALLPKAPVAEAGTSTELTLELNGAFSRGPVRRPVKDRINLNLGRCGMVRGLKVRAVRARGSQEGGSNNG